MKKISYFALIALVSASLASCGSKTTKASEGASDPGEVVKAGYTALFEGGDLAQYVEPSTPAEEKENINKIAKENADGLKSQNGSLKEFKVLNVETNGDAATVKVCMVVSIGGMESPDTSEVKVKKVDGKWCLLASDFK